MISTAHSSDRSTGAVGSADAEDYTPVHDQRRYPAVAQ
jgi:hypothetical protein